MLDQPAAASPSALAAAADGAKPPSTIKRSKCDFTFAAKAALASSGGGAADTFGTTLLSVPTAGLLLA